MASEQPLGVAKLKSQLWTDSGEALAQNTTKNGACDNFVLDLCGAKFGACKNCGFVRKDHTEQRDSKGPSRVPVGGKSMEDLKAQFSEIKSTKKSADAAPTDTQIEQDDQDQGAPRSRSHSMADLKAQLDEIKSSKAAPGHELALQQEDQMAEPQPPTSVAPEIRVRTATVEDVRDSPAPPASDVIRVEKVVADQPAASDDRNHEDAEEATAAARQVAAEAKAEIDKAMASMAAAQIYLSRSASNIEPQAASVESQVPVQVDPPVTQPVTPGSVLSRPASTSAPASAPPLPENYASIRSDSSLFAPASSLFAIQFPETASPPPPAAAAEAAEAIETADVPMGMGMGLPMPGMGASPGMLAALKAKKTIREAAERNAASGADEIQSLETTTRPATKAAEDPPEAVEATEATDAAAVPPPPSTSGGEVALEKGDYGSDGEDEAPPKQASLDVTPEKPKRKSVQELGGSLFGGQAPPIGGMSLPMPGMGASPSTLAALKAKKAAREAAERNAAQGADKAGDAAEGVSHADVEAANVKPKAAAGRVSIGNDDNNGLAAVTAISGAELDPKEVVQDSVQSMPQNEQRSAQVSNTGSDTADVVTEPVHRVEKSPLVECCEVLYDYEAPGLEFLAMKKGDVVTIVSKHVNGWWDGVLEGKQGFFPSNYTKMCTSSTPNASAPPAPAPTDPTPKTESTTAVTKKDQQNEPEAEDPLFAPAGGGKSAEVTVESVEDDPLFAPAGGGRSGGGEPAGTAGESAEDDPLFAPGCGGSSKPLAETAIESVEDDPLFAPPGASVTNTVQSADFGQPIMVIPKWKQRQLDRQKQMNEDVAEQTAAAEAAHPDVKLEQERAPDPELESFMDKMDLPQGQREQLRTMDPQTREAFLQSAKLATADADTASSAKLDGDDRIGLPYNFQHLQHATVNEDGLTGIPTEWEESLAVFPTTGPPNQPRASPQLPAGAPPVPPKLASSSTPPLPTSAPPIPPIPPELGSKLRPSTNPSSTAPNTQSSQSPPVPSAAATPSGYSYALRPISPPVNDGTQPELGTEHDTPGDDDKVVIVDSLMDYDPALATQTQTPAQEAERALFVDTDYLMARLVLIKDQMTRPNVLLAGACGSGKSSIINAIFGDDLASAGAGAPITQRFTKFEPIDRPVTIYDAKGLEHGRSEEYINEMSAFTQEHTDHVDNPKDRLHVIWYVVNLATARWQQFDSQLVQSVFGTVPIVFVLNKADLVEPHVVEAIVQQITNLGLSHCHGIHPVSAVPRVDLDAVPEFCPECGSDEIVINKKSQTYCCTSSPPHVYHLPKPSTGLDGVVGATMNALSTNVGEAFAAAQQVSVSAKVEVGKDIIRDHVKRVKRIHNRYKVTEQMVDMVVRLGRLWEFIDDDGTGQVERTMRSSRIRGSVTASNEVTVMRAVAKRRSVAQSNSYVSFFSRLQLLVLDAFESVTQSQARVGAEGILMYRSFAEAYQSVAARIVDESQTELLKANFDAPDPHTLAVIEACMRDEGIEAAFTRFLEPEVLLIPSEDMEISSPTLQTVPEVRQQSLAPRSVATAASSKKATAMFVTGQQGSVRERGTSVGDQLETSRREAFINAAGETRDAMRRAMRNVTLPAPRGLKFRRKQMENNKEGSAGTDTVPKPVHFGVQLDQQSGGVPVVFRLLTEHLSQDSTVSTEGIFRIPGAAIRIRNMRRLIEEAGPDITSLPKEDVEDQSAAGRAHVLASLLKEWIRELPDPLIPFDIYPKMIDSQRHNSTEELNDAMASLPPTNAKMFSILLETLRKVVARREVNKMGSHNLAVCFAPDVLRGEKEDLATVMLETPLAIRCLEKMIEVWKK